MNAQIGRDSLFFRRDTSAVRLQDSTALPVAALDSTAKSHKKGPVRRFFTKDYPKPRRAMLLSLTVPGAGQAYNKKWWKIPIVWGVLGGLGYLEADNIYWYTLFRDSYKAQVDDDPNTIVTDPRLIDKDSRSLKSYRDVARRNLELSSIFLGLGYLLNSADAFTDAHLATFDVSDDLSFRIKPSIEPAPGVPAIGLGLAMRW